MSLSEVIIQTKVHSENYEKLIGAVEKPFKVSYLSLGTYTYDNCGDCECSTGSAGCSAGC